MRGVPRAATALGDGDLYAHHLIDRREHDDDAGVDADPTAVSSLARLPGSRQVRDDADHPLYEEELGTVMHLMLLDA